MMKDRCYNPNSPFYKNYGGRGIKVCEEWNKEFLNFYNWSIQNGHQKDLSIDRKDNNGDYCPDNCRWATDKQQQRNKGLYSNNVAGCNGVQWIKKTQKWRVLIRTDEGRLYLGCFDDIDDAVKIRKEAEKIYW